ncbi:MULTISPECIES: triacylglycerol lipase [unclassified Lentimonas]|uniref:esterase/lipase family protein n=1 Tax=unclassified Lentimonas TaxID=2630993 RepID=UPI00138979BA|nr:MULTISPECIES: alpha/beta fold hydrolase [unclassified Lentimonas]
MKHPLTILCLLCALTAPLAASDVVILLHGLARTSSSMEKMADTLTTEGYVVHNLDYPSRHQSIETLATMVRAQVAAATESDDTIHFVTHSLGGIIVRTIQKESALENIGHVVMLSPPNQGSELVDTLGDYSAFGWINGPAGDQLGTDINGFIAKLGPVDFPLCVITGDRSINGINSCIIPGDDDGKVSIESAKVEGMDAYKVIHATHPYIMKNKEAIALTVEFLKTGALAAPSTSKPKDSSTTAQ